MKVSEMKGYLDTLTAKLCHSNPDAKVEESMVWEGNEVTLSIVGGGWFVYQNGTAYPISSLICPKDVFESLMQQVSQKVEDRIATMDAFLRKALEKEMGKIVLDTLSGNKVSLPERFSKMMEGSLLRLIKPFQNTQPPYNYLRIRHEFGAGDLFKFEWAGIDAGIDTELHLNHQTIRSPRSDELSFSNALLGYQHMEEIVRVLKQLWEEAEMIKERRRKGK